MERVVPRPDRIQADPETIRRVLELGGTTHYVRHSGALPHLTDDPRWEPRPQSLPRPVTENDGFIDRIRTLLTG